MNTPLIEGCVDCFPSAAAACRGGADRLELCADLVIGGTTPSRSLFCMLKERLDVKINVLIRPRFGDFLYDEYELAQMAEEIAAFRALGANGVVIGALTPEGDLDIGAMTRLMDAARGMEGHLHVPRLMDMEVTLHRAFDLARDPFEALEAAISLGCTTILTSGQAPSAPEGAALLKELLRRADGRIDIMAGSGVRSGAIAALHAATGIRVYHTTGRRGPVDSAMRYRREGVPMGLPGLSEYQLWRTDEAEFRACAQAVHALA